MNAFIVSTLYIGYFSAAVTAICMRIVGGDPTSIEEYPTTAAVLLIGDKRPSHICGGTILNKRNILTAAHCFMNAKKLMLKPKKYLVRVGSTLANSGGIIHNVESITCHPNWNMDTVDNDIAVMRTSSPIVYTQAVQPANIAGPKYRLRDNEPVWAIGWGLTAENGNVSEELRHVRVFNINRDICRSRYKEYVDITDNMLCSGWLDVGGRDQCTRDSGSPLYHNNVVVGISSFGVGCARPCYPGINADVTRFTDWIRRNTKLARSNYQTLNHKAPSTKISFDWKSFLKMI